MRHAKSDWSNDDEDFARPLNMRGKRAAIAIAKEILKRNCVPQIIYSSPAKRAEQTTKAFVKECDVSKVEWISNFYEGHTKDYISAIQNTKQSFNRIMIVGHNPVLESLSSLLIIKNVLKLKLTTANVVSLSFDVDNWNDVDAYKGKLDWILTPKMLGEEE